MKNTLEPATIELIDSFPGMIVEPPELPEVEIADDWNI